MNEGDTIIDKEDRITPLDRIYTLDHLDSPVSIFRGPVGTAVIQNTRRVGVRDRISWRTTHRIACIHRCIISGRSTRLTPNVKPQASPDASSNRYIVSMPRKLLSGASWGAADAQVLPTPRRMIRDVKVNLRRDVVGHAKGQRRGCSPGMGSRDEGSIPTRGVNRCQNPLAVALCTSWASRRIAHLLDN